MAVGSNCGVEGRSFPLPLPPALLFANFPVRKGEGEGERGLSWLKRSPPRSEQVEKFGNAGRRGGNVTPARVTRASRSPFEKFHNVLSCFRVFATWNKVNYYTAPSRLVSQPHVLSHAGQNIAAACCLLVEGARVRMCVPCPPFQTFSQTWLFPNRETNGFLKFVLIRSHFPTQSWVYSPFHPPLSSLSSPTIQTWRNETRPRLLLMSAIWIFFNQTKDTAETTTRQYNKVLLGYENQRDVKGRWQIFSFICFFVSFVCLLACSSPRSLFLCLVFTALQPLFVLFCLHNFPISPYLLVRWLNEVELANKRETHRCKKK